MTTDFHREPAYGAQMATYFRLPKALSLVIQPVAKPPIAITRLVSETGLAERSENIPVERAFVVSMHLTPHHELACGWCRHLRSRSESSRPQSGSRGLGALPYPTRDIRCVHR
jgi:hypothetical protein